MSWLKCVVCNRKSNESTTLFRFPADLEKRLEWTTFLDLDVDQLKLSDRLCSWHFETAAFKFTVQRGKKFVLKASAVPTIKNVETLATMRDRSVGKYKTCESGIDGFYYYCAVCGLVDRKRTRFTFPTAKKELDQWLAFCGVNIVDFKPKSHRLCISHFKKDDLIQQRAARNTKRFLLKPGTIPTLNKPESLKEEYLSDEDDSQKEFCAGESPTKPSRNEPECDIEPDYDDANDELKSIKESTEFAEYIIKYVDDEQEESTIKSKLCAGTKAKVSGTTTAGTLKRKSFGNKTLEFVAPESSPPAKSSLPVHLDEINEGDYGSSKLALSILRAAKRERAEHLKELNAVKQRLRMLEKKLGRKATIEEEENAESEENEQLSLNQEELDSDFMLGSDLETDTESNASGVEFEMSCANVTTTEDIENAMPIEMLEEVLLDPLSNELPETYVTEDDNQSIEENGNQSIEENDYQSIDDNKQSIDDNNQSDGEEIAVIAPTKAGKPLRAICPYCKKTLNKKFLKRHIEHVHMLTKDALQKCQYCSKSFPELTLRRHIRQVHENKEYLCDICSTTFKAEGSLRRHALTHSDKRERNYTCEVCGLKFLTLSHVTGHQSTHDKERKPEFACDQCDRTFYYKGGLTTHKKVHSNRAAECSVCKKRFARQIDLKIHMRSHSGEMPFKCNLCPKAFRHRTPYRQHMLMHQGHVFKCDICGTDFKSFNSLAMHRKKHTGLPMKCKICNKEFVTNYKARLHVQKVHKITKDEDKHLLKIQQKSYVPRKSRLLEALHLQSAAIN